MGTSSGFRFSWPIKKPWSECSAAEWGEEALCLCVDGSQQSSSGVVAVSGRRAAREPCVLLGQAQSWEEPEARHSLCCEAWKARRHMRPLSPLSYSGSVETLLSLARLLSPSPELWWAFQFLSLGSLDFCKKFIPYLNGFCFKMFFLVPFRKWHNYKCYRQKWRDGRELLPADSPVTKVNSALMKLLRGLYGHENLLYLSF